MLKIKITWPVLFLLLLALFVWLIRSSEQPQSRRRQTARPASKPMPRCNNGTGKQPFVIHVDETHPFDAAGGTDSDDYDVETARLDQEAADAAHATHTHSSAQHVAMRKGAWQE